MYPDVTLAKAREKHQDARRLLDEGVDPGEAKKADKRAAILAAANSFEAVAREWFARQEKVWTPDHSCKVIGRLETDLFPWLGKRPIAEITAPELLEVLRRAETRTVETAHRELQTYGQIARYAIQTGRAERDISSDLRGALTPYRRKQFAHSVDPGEIAVQMRKIHAVTGTFPVLCALRLVPLIFSRAGELVRMKWAEIDLENGLWTYHVSKVDREHIAALPAQAVDMLRELHPLTGHHEYVFPGQGKNRESHISGGGVLNALRRAGVEAEEQTLHGYRHTASTLLNESGRWNPDAIEAALTHKMPGVRGVYAGRAKYLEERVRMIQAWADYLDSLRLGATVIPLTRHQAA